MVAYLPSIPYPPPGDGHWSPVTATLDWCEENYYATPWSAEIVNTLTNLTFLYLAYRGISSCIRNGHDTVFLVSFIGYLIVGTGSFAFHSTLKYPMQLVDELSMIYTTCIMFYASFARGRSSTFSVTLSIALAALAIFITGYYHYLKDPAFHQIAYGILTAVVLFRSMYVMEIGLRPQWKAKERSLRLRGLEYNHDAKVKPAHENGQANGHGNGNGKGASNGSLGVSEQIRVDARDVKILQTMWTMIAVGLTSFLSGFALWNIDNEFCGTLRQWRHDIGLPWGILLEGHGWWHILTGLGAYYYLVWGIWLRHCLNNRQDEFKLVWPSKWTSVPSVERVRSGSKHTRQKTM